MDTTALKLLQQSDRPHYSRMAIALLLSIVFHALLLLINFVPINSHQAVSKIAVTLVNHQTRHAPLNPQAVAQKNLDGGGQAQLGMASSPLPYTNDQDDQTMVLKELRKRQTLLEQQQQKLLIQLKSDQTTATKETTTKSDGQTEQQGIDYYNQQSQVLNAQIAAIQEQIKKYNQQPRKTFVAPSTKAVNYAEYVEAWRTKIEAIGTKHYPEQARGKIYGDLQLTVYIRKDGHLDHIEFNRPAKQSILNSAAKRIIELAEPFQPLPPEISQDTDILAITRTWYFTRHGLATN